MPLLALSVMIGCGVTALASGAPAAIPDVEWRLIARGGSAPDRALHSMILDPVNERMWVFGGVEADAQSDHFRNLVYSLDLTDPDAQWQRSPIGGLQPPPTAYHTATYDPLRCRMIVYGGLVDRTAFSDQQPADGNAVWYLDLTDPEKVTWSREQVPGNPIDRFAHAAVYVPEYDALVVSGGAQTFRTATSTNYALLLGETPKRWVRLANAGFSPRAGHVMALDAMGQRLLAYGGLDDFTDITTSDVLQLDISAGLDTAKAWTRVATASPGIPRAFAAAAFDLSTRLWWVQGGIQGDSTFLRDLSVLDVAAAKPEWTRTQVVVNGPLDRFGHVAALDPPRSRIIFQGGTPDNAVTKSDTRSLGLAPAATASPTASATPLPPAATATPSPTATFTPLPPTPTATASPNPSASATGSLAGSATPTASASATASGEPSETATATVEATLAPTSPPGSRIYLPVSHDGSVP